MNMLFNFAEDAQASSSITIANTKQFQLLGIGRFSFGEIVNS